MKTLLLALLLVSALDAKPVSLFDGKSLDGWAARPGEEKWWKVEDGMIVGGSLTEEIPHNTFLASTKSYRNFDLKYKIRLVKGDGFMNSGMQIRSRRMDNDPEMIGYQVDAGVGYWGDLYDESRRNVALVKGGETLAKEWDWNEYRVLCEGVRVRAWINGAQVCDYTEQDAEIPQDGLLGIQAHGGGKVLVQVKDIVIDVLPAHPDGARTAEDERAGFLLPEGFTAELVASEEEGVGKPITVVWDRHGKMWTMTAFEYPVDANENEDVARQLFEQGGKDKVLVFDEPNGPGPQTPHMFADQLAIPLGLLPMPDGTALVQHGPEIRRYRDADGNGVADGHDVLLEGFGFQDSHLFPHQFERAPGGWIYLAQGAFNYSKVRRPGGLPFADGSMEVVFNNCKLGRFRPDGSEFQPLTGGPNNIWGLSISRTGETFIQEANDLGYPVAEFAPGTHYPTGFGPRLRDDAPILPQSTAGQPMGGTGLSGLALAEDANTPFAAGFGDAKVFYIANPITSRLQIVTMTQDANGHPTYKKQDDFLISDDLYFRPVAIHFGPDGCLYVVDWYNKIISHNEVPRTHPDRDKTHGRIWRIRHASQKPAQRVDFASLTDAKLLDFLGGANARVASQAWHEIADRKPAELMAPLEKIVTDAREPLARRMGALWALEGAGGVKTPLIVTLAAAQEPQFQHEAVRMAGELSLSEEDFLAVISALGDAPGFRVRAAIANAVRYHRNPTAAVVACAARLGMEPLGGSSRDAYDRNFERYLARWAMAEHQQATQEMLAQVELPAEARLLAVRSMDDAVAAAKMVEILPELERPLVPEELSLLARQLNQPAVQQGLAEMLTASGEKRERVLETMTRLDTKAAAVPELAAAVASAAEALLAEQRTPAREALVVNLARHFRITALADEVRDWATAPNRTAPELADGLEALREIGASKTEVFHPFLDHQNAAVRRAALAGFGSVDDVAVVAEFANRWAGLPGAARSLAIDGMTGSAQKAAAFARALVAGSFEGFDGTAVEKVITALGSEDPAVVALLETQKGLLRPIIRFGGSGPGRVVTNTTLKGPFTVEAWVKMPGRIDQNDGMLGSEGGPDFNFAGGQFRVYGGNAVGDLIIAKRVATPGIWTHFAISRDAQNHFHIHVDGEPDPAPSQKFDGDFTNLNLGENHRGHGTEADFDEVRIWDHARTDEEIRRDFQTAMEGPAPEGLVARFTGSELGGTPEGSARPAMSMDFPALVTPTEALALEKKFDRFREWASHPGDVANGRLLVQATCLICHRVQDEGIAIGPDLSGAGAMGTEALLRNILTPNAQLESGYYRHDVKLSDGSVFSGFLAGESDDAITLRIIGGDERVIPRKDVVSHTVSKRSLMPEGLIEGYDQSQVSDIFSYLNTLR